MISIDWIDAGDLDDSPSSWFSQEEALKVFKEIPVQTIAVYFGHGKENLFLVRDTENQDVKNPYYNAKSAVLAAVPAAEGGITYGAQGFVLVTGAVAGKIVTIATCTEKVADCTAATVTNTVEIE